MSSTTGQRYIHHAAQGSHVFLFIRLRHKEGQLSVPYFFAGPVRYVRHSGNKPIAIVWELARALPGDLHAEAKLAAG